MNKKMFTIGIPCIFAGIFLVVIMGIYSLNNMDKRLAEENARTAFFEAYSDFVESEVDITKTMKLYANESFMHSGSFAFSETDLIDNAYISVLEDIPVKFSVARYPSQRLTRADIILEGDGQIHFDGYVNDESVTFKLSEFYDGYFTIPNKDIKENYNESLWFNLLGDIMYMVPEGFSINLYPEFVAENYVLSEYLKKNEDKGLLKEIAKEVSFEKTATQRDFLVGDTYVATNEYVVSLSKSAMSDIRKLVADYIGIDEEKIWETGKYEFLAYISANNRLIGTKFNFSIAYNDMPYETEVLFSFLGNENVFDRTTVDIQLLGQDNSIYTFKVLLTNEATAKKQNITLIAAMNQPYVSRLCEVELDRNLETDEISINAAINIPGLKGIINYNGKVYNEEILIPENSYNIYELNLWQILNIYSSTNWSFIK